MVEKNQFVFIDSEPRIGTKHNRADLTLLHHAWPHPHSHPHPPLGDSKSGHRWDWNHLAAPSLMSGRWCWLLAGTSAVLSAGTQTRGLLLCSLGMGWLASSWPGSIPREQSANLITFYNLALEDTNITSAIVITTQIQGDRPYRR